MFFLLATVLDCLAILLVLAAYTRQTYVLAAPLAALVWLWPENRKQAYLFLGIWAGLGLILFASLTMLTGGGFFYHLVVANLNQFTLKVINFEPVSGYIVQSEVPVIWVGI